MFGAAPAILGTVYTSLLALLLAAPVGVMVAIFLVEMAPRARCAPGLASSSNCWPPCQASSTACGRSSFWFRLSATDIQPPLIDHFGNIFLFQGYPIGLGVFTAALILSIMILPTIASISRDVMLAVPNAQRDAMLALGATKWETTWKAVIPYARSGIIGAIVLALGRAVGETMAVQMVIGNTQTFNLSLFNFGTTLPTTIVNQFTEATGDTYRSALIELALILMVVAIVLNAIARLLVWRVTPGRGVTDEDVLGAQSDQSVRAHPRHRVPDPGHRSARRHDVLRPRHTAAHHSISISSPTCRCRSASRAAEC